MVDGQSSIAAVDEAVVASIITGLLPNADERLCVLRQLVASANEADRLAPDAWSVTLFRNGFRLNVGQVEVLVLNGQELLVNLAAQVGVGPFCGDNYCPATYRSMPSPQASFRGPVDRWSKIEPEVVAAHGAFVVRAAVTVEGRPRRGTPFRRSHCPEVMSYARTAVREAELATNVAVDLSSGDEVLAAGVFVEGGRVAVLVNVYERKRAARDRCKSHYGASCVICGFSFGAAYRCAEAEGYIQVHHLTPVSAIGQQYVVDPIADLRPVCANCHAVIHLRTPPFSVDEMRNLLASSVGDGRG